MSARFAWAPPVWQARRYLVAFDVCWGLWAVAATIGLTVGPDAATPMLVVLIPATAYSQGLGYKIEGGDATAYRPLDTFGCAGRRLHLPTHLRAQVNMLRPTFVRNIATASGWQAGRAAGAVSMLTVLNLALFVAVVVVGPA